MSKKLSPEELRVLAEEMIAAEDPREVDCLAEKLLDGFYGDDHLGTPEGWFRSFRRHFRNVQLKDDQVERAHYDRMVAVAQEEARKKEVLKKAIAALGTPHCAEWLEQHLPHCCEWQDLRVAGLTVERLGGIASWVRVYLQDWVMRYELPGPPAEENPGQ